MPRRVIVASKRQPLTSPFTIPPLQAFYTLLI